MNQDGTFIRFVEAQVPKGYKTRAWNVCPKDSGPDMNWIGGVRWYAPWRKYCYFAGTRTVYEQVCLREIAAFCEARTAEHRAAKAS